MNLKLTQDIVVDIINYMLTSWKAVLDLGLSKGRFSVEDVT